MKHVIVTGFNKNIPRLKTLPSLLKHVINQQYHCSWDFAFGIIIRTFFIRTNGIAPILLFLHFLLSRFSCKSKFLKNFAQRFSSKRESLRLRLGSRTFGRLVIRSNVQLVGMAICHYGESST